jgi:hypothetical protein
VEFQPPLIVFAFRKTVRGLSDQSLNWPQHFRSGPPGSAILVRRHLVNISLQTPNESPMDVKGQFGVDGDAARHDMKGPLEMSRADSY